MVKDKGKPRDYKEWQPEYTPKTHNLTKASQRKLDAIRGQAIAEGTLDNFDTDDGLSIAAFVGLTFLFKYGINPSVLGLFEKGKEVVDAISQKMNEFSIWFFNIEGETRVTKEMRIRTYLDEVGWKAWVSMTTQELLSEQESHQKIMEGNIKTRKRQEDAALAQIKQYEDNLVWMREQRDKFWKEGTITKGDMGGESAGDRMQMSIERMEYVIANLRTMIYGGDIVNPNIDIETGIRGEYVRTVECGYRCVIDRLNEQIEIIKQQIESAILSKAAADKLARKMDTLNWIFSMGEAGGFIYVAKSYEVAEIISNAKPFG